MTKEQLIALGIPEEQATKAAQASQEELKGYIPKQRFDEVNNDKKKLEEDVKTRDQQIEDLKKVDAKALQDTITKLQEDNKAATEKHAAEVKQMRVNAAVDKALTAAKAKNLTAVRALLNLDKAELDGENVKGLDEQIKKLQTEDGTKFLFDSAKPTFKGLKPGEGKGPGDRGSAQPSSLADAVKMHFEAQE